MTLPKAASYAVAILLLAGCSQPDDATEPGALERLAVGETIDAPLEETLGPFRVETDGIAIEEVEVEPEPETTSQTITSDEEPTEASPEPTAPPAPEQVPCRAFVLDGPTFPTNDARLTPTAEEVIDQLISEINSRTCGRDSDATVCAVQDMQVELRGHTDDVPTSRPGGNQQLSVDRAQSVADKFIAAKFTIRSVTGFADTIPAPGTDDHTLEEARAKNRRTEILLWCQA